MRHQQACFESGAQFEGYVTDVLTRHHDDYINPAPAGTLGDGGCDGLAESGTILYACYGQRPMRDAERELSKKLRSDFARGSTEWTAFTMWRFVTNAPVGPLTLRTHAELQQQHGPDSERPLTLRIWQTDKLWSDVVGKLSQQDLDELFPGAPGIANVELGDLLPLLDALDTVQTPKDVGASIPPVPETKMAFNQLSEAARIEFNAGRLMAPRIDRWYSESSDPTVFDAHGDRFKQLYLEARATVSDPTEILERLYVALAGPNFRMDSKRANAAYAVVSYFFDSCHIFETPPAGGEDAAASDEGDLPGPSPAYDRVATSS
ncbi:ABC-three component system protein [Agromyces bauzanensis]